MECDQGTFNLTRLIIGVENCYDGCTLEIRDKPIVITNVGAIPIDQMALEKLITTSKLSEQQLRELTDYECRVALSKESARELVALYHPSIGCHLRPRD